MLFDNVRIETIERLLNPSNRNELVKMARVLHDANKVWSEYNGDENQKNWDETPELVKNSMLNSMKWRLENLNAPVKDSHDYWLKAKTDDGYTYGKVECHVKKIHPRLLPFEDLNYSDQFKSWTFMFNMRSYLLGMQHSI